MDRLRVVTGLAAAALLAACAGHRFEDESDLETAHLRFRLPRTGWESEVVPARRGEVGIVEVPGGDAVGGLELEMEFSVEAISAGSAHVLFRPADALAWPSREECVRCSPGGWTPSPWTNADLERGEVALVAGAW